VLHNLIIPDDNSVTEHVTDPDPYTQLIESICDEVLPNMVRIYESRKLEDVLDYQYFISLIERKVEQANKALTRLDPEKQPIYRARINASYAASIDRLLAEMQDDLEVTTRKLEERVKELRCLYSISSLLSREDLPLEEILRGVAEILPSGMQVAESCGARIRMGDREWVSPGFSDSPWRLSAVIRGEEGPLGSVDVCYTVDISGGERAFFLDEERQLLGEVALRLGEARQHRRAHEVRSRLASIVECADEAIIGKDLKGTILSWNRGAERVYGYRAEEVIGKPISILLSPGYPDDIPSILEKIRGGERLEHYETRRMCKDGRVIPVSLSVSPVRDPGGKITGISTIARDISREKRDQAALMEQVHLVRELLNRIPVPVFFKDARGNYLGCNRAFEDLSGLSRDEIIGRSVSDLWPPGMSDHYSRIDQEILASGEVHQDEVEFTTRGEGARSFLFTRAPFYRADGSIRGIVGIMAEITPPRGTEKPSGPSREDPGDAALPPEP
jgi:PAS domain S-box-containing protein